MQNWQQAPEGDTQLNILTMLKGLKANGNSSSNIGSIVKGCRSRRTNELSFVGVDIWVGLVVDAVFQILILVHNLLLDTCGGNSGSVWEIEHRNT